MEQQVNVQEQKEDLTRKVEAILFITGRFMLLEEFLPYCHNISVQDIKTALDELKREYEQKQTSLEIFSENDKWKLGLKRAFNYLTSTLISDAELDRPTQETLAVIAYKQPMTQSEVIKLRGNKSYDHIAKLKELDFITSEKFGRTRLLKLTQKFFDYFDIPDTSLKQEFQKIEGKVLQSLEKEAKKILGEEHTETNSEVKENKEEQNV